MTGSPSIAVIIPTLNEAACIESCLRETAVLSPDELVVADAGSSDETVALARGHARVIEPFRDQPANSQPRGRGAQQNAGARATHSEILVFLHADSRLEPKAICELRAWAKRCPAQPGGCFRMRVESRRQHYRLVGHSADFRAGLLNLPYGDQCLFARRSAFERVNGFPEIALMDDLFFSRRLARLGRLAVLESAVHTSPRRWEKRGFVRQTLLNWRLTALVFAGVHPNQLAPLYRPAR